MKWLTVALTALALTLTACGDMGFVTSAPNPFGITPTRPPAIFSPTPIFIYSTTSDTLPPPPSVTPSLTLAAGPSPTSTIPPTATETFTPSPTVTNTAETLAIQLLGCDTGLDVTHGMGEVTNAYVTIMNASGPDLTTVCATLSSADEGRVHPDKTVCMPSLPRGYQVTLKLTIDTTFRMDTIVSILVTSDAGMAARADSLACKDIGALKPEPETIGVLQPIP